jgi:hypothetical protein
MVGAGAPVGAVEPSLGQVWLALTAAANSSQVRPTLHHCFGTTL